jgi:hypothetical protein
MLTGPGEDAMDILEQGAFEKRQRAGFLQSIDDDYVLSVKRVAGLMPLEIFSELRVEKDGSQLLQLFLPTFRVGDKGIDLGIGFARCGGH